MVPSVLGFAQCSLVPSARRLTATKQMSNSGWQSAHKASNLASGTARLIAHLKIFMCIGKQGTFFYFTASKSFMRRLLFILLIALLPLRGWVGDAMATGMAAQQVRMASISVALEHTHAPLEVTHGHQAANTDIVVVHADECHGATGGATPHSADSHCESCAVCQACHTVALSLAASCALARLAPALPPQTMAAHFASAEAALGQKPPIS